MTAETPTVLGLKRMVADAITDAYFEHKPIFVLDDQGEVHRINAVRWSEANDCFWLVTENDVAELGLTPRAVAGSGGPDGGDRG